MWVTASEFGTTPVRERVAVQQLLEQLRTTLVRRLPPNFELVDLYVELTRREPESGSGGVTGAGATGARSAG